MKKYRLSEELGNIDEAFLEEVFEYQKRSEGRQITMSKKRIIQTVIAAALAIAVCGITVFAVHMSSLAKLKDYVDKQDDYNNVPDVLKGVDVEEVGTDFVENVEPGEAKITSIVAGENGFMATFDVNINDSDLVDKVEDWELGWYSWNNFAIYEITPDGEKLRFGGALSGPQLVSCENGILTFGLDGFANSGLPDELGFSADGFVFHNVITDEEVEYTFEHGFDTSVKKDSYTEMETLTSKEPQNIKGIEFSIKMDGLGLLLYADEMTVEEHNDVILYIWNECLLKFTLKDGTEIIDMPVLNLEKMSAEEYFAPDRINLLSGGGTQRNGIYYKFATVFDITQIESVEIEGAVFTF